MTGVVLLALVGESVSIGAALRVPEAESPSQALPESAASAPDPSAAASAPLPATIPPGLRDPSTVRRMIEQYEYFDRELSKQLDTPPTAVTNADPILKSLDAEGRRVARELLNSPGRHEATVAAREAFDRGNTEGAALALLPSLPQTSKLEQRGVLISQMGRLRATGYYAERNLRAAAAANEVPVPLDGELRSRLGLLTGAAERRQLDDAMRIQLEEFNQRVEEADRLMRRQAFERLSKLPTDPSATVTRSAPCPPTEPPLSSGDTLPGVVSDKSAGLEEFYPQDARRESYEGTVVVRVSVSRSGCAETAQAFVKGPDPRLDQAAIRWVLEGATFRQGVRDGKPEEFVFLLNVRFRLAD